MFGCYNGYDDFVISLFLLKRKVPFVRFCRFKQVSVTRMGVIDVYGVFTYLIIVLYHCLRGE